MKKTMKKLAVLTAILAVALAGCGNPSGGEPVPEPPRPWDGGDGSEADPYVIGTEAQLAYLAGQVNAGTDDYEDEYFILARNLDLDGHEWEAIGTYNHRFKGNFDGDHHIIFSLNINKSDTDYQGLFGYLEGAEISNLGLKDVAIQGKNYVGGIAGAVGNGSKISGSYSTGTVSGKMSGTECTGGIAGLVYSSSIDNSYSTGAVSGVGDVGGIAGAVINGSKISGSYSTGTVSGSQWVGGIAGQIINSNIENCAALNPTVTASNSAGRVVGYIDGTGNTFAGNVAWGDMVVSGSAVINNSEKDGKGITREEVQEGSELPASLKTNPWTCDEGKLPILDGLEGQDGTLPDHLAAAD
jgi:hypothetical protein